MELKSILVEHGVRIAPEGHHHTRHGYINFDCPFCGMNTAKYHCGYSLQRGTVNCWKCGRHSLRETLQELLGVNYAVSLDYVRSVSRVRAPQIPTTVGKYQEPEGVGELKPPHAKYLKSRGLDPEKLERIWKIKGIGLSADLPWRIFIPIQYRKRSVSWTTRSIDPEARQRYISASSEQESTPHKQILYGIDYCKTSVVVVEGPIGAWVFGPGTVATCGTAYTQGQIELLSRFQRRAICFDREPVAQQRARALADTLSVFPGETSVIELDSDDPGVATAEEVSQIRRLFLDG